jgi:hypothetical protein
MQGGVAPCMQRFPGCLPCAPQTYYKLSYVDRRVTNPEQRICEDIPKLCDGLGDLVGEWTKCAVDAVFYSWVLRSYTRTNKYTAIIIAYVFGAGAMTVSMSPNFGRLFKRQANNEGAQHCHGRLHLHGASKWFSLAKLCTALMSEEIACMEKLGGFSDKVCVAPPNQGSFFLYLSGKLCLIGLWGY